MKSVGFPARGVLRRKAARIRAELIQAYGTPHWESSLTAVDELVATVLSQNTSDINSGRAFGQLLERYGSMEAVRDADPAELIATIRPAGLANQKGPRIQAVLRAITEARGTLDLKFLRKLTPAEGRAWLTQFNGVGPKTASIVLLFALGIPTFPVDTHVHRVTGRLGLRPETLSADDSHEWLEGLFVPEAYHDAHINLIRHGREICHARNPKCEICPLQRLCADFQARSARRVPRKT
ncbi:MAG: endonuclease III [Anaerolineales bacterium]|nr:endonuclease III [Anaerolineales bacterium]